MAWQDICPHRGASLALGWVEGDTLVCPYHGLAFIDPPTDQSGDSWINELT
ncbi:MAG: Rieske (2Fe-2S) protein [Chroococcidiopsidaceae cyanobacterium CP_BM_ER_R8_30]|nr:Rieske (2Fe-2S) protein [Chroococcidiopsidaceae cyanobacterium CP_BM_ER_R8_30]